MFSQRRKSIKKTVAYILTCIFAYVITVAFFSGSSSRQSYGILSNWWCALYVGNILRIDDRSAPLVFAIYTILGILAPYLGWTWFYHDLPDKFTFSYGVTIAVGGLLFASPIIINNFIMHLKEKITSRR